MKSLRRDATKDTPEAYDPHSPLHRSVCLRMVAADVRRRIPERIDPGKKVEFTKHTKWKGVGKFRSVTSQVRFALASTKPPCLSFSCVSCVS